MSEGVWSEADVIFQYTRAQALADGVLVEIDSNVCREAGFRYPVAVTRSVWSNLIELNPAAERAGCDISGRTWDILWMLRVAIKGAPDGDTIPYSLCVVVPSDSPYRRSRHEATPSLVALKSVCGPDDNGEPCITIMMHDED